MFDGMEKVLKEVRYIPELKRNLITLGMVDKASYTIKTKSGVLKVTKGSMTIMKGIIKNDLYTLIGKIVLDEAFVVQNQKHDKVQLWHFRLGHIGQKSIKELEKQDLLGNEKLEELPFYEDCVLGKATNLSFKISVHQTKQTLDSINSDLCGPSRVPSQGGANFFFFFYY